LCLRESERLSALFEPSADFFEQQVSFHRARKRGITFSKKVTCDLFVIFSNPIGAMPGGFTRCLTERQYLIDCKPNHYVLMKKLQALLIICLLGCNYSIGQDTARYEIRYVTLHQALQEGDVENDVVKRKKILPTLDGVSEAQIVRLDFFDKQAGEAIGSFDVYANSPFEILNHPKTGVNYYGGSIYQVERVLSEDIDLYLKKPIPNQHSMYDTMPPPPYEVHSIISLGGEGKNFATISYRCYAIKRYDGFTGVEESWGEDITTSLYTIKVLNNRGKIIHEYDNLELDDFIPVTTDNGKYVAVKYEECDRWDCSPPIRRGLKFVRLEDGKVFDFPISLEEKTCCVLASEGSLFFYLTEIWRTPLVRDETWRIFDIEKMIFYEKIIPDSERGRLQKWGPDGFEFKYPDRSGTYTYTLEIDFQKIKIQEP